MTEKELGAEQIIAIWKRYMEEEDQKVSQAGFLQNMEQKICEPDILGDMQRILRPELIMTLKKLTGLCERNCWNKK